MKNRPKKEEEVELVSLSKFVTLRLCSCLIPGLNPEVFLFRHFNLSERSYTQSWLKAFSRIHILSVRNTADRLLVEYSLARKHLKVFHKHFDFNYSSEKHPGYTLSSEDIMFIFEASILDTLRQSVAISHGIEKFNGGTGRYGFFPDSFMFRMLDHFIDMVLSGLKKLPTIPAIILRKLLAIKKRIFKWSWKVILYPLAVIPVLKKVLKSSGLLDFGSFDLRYIVRKITVSSALDLLSYLSIENRLKMKRVLKQKAGMFIAKFKKKLRRKAMPIDILIDKVRSDLVSDPKFPKKGLIVNLIDSSGSLNFFAIKNVLKRLSKEGYHFIVLPFGVEGTRTGELSKFFESIDATHTFLSFEAAPTESGRKKLKLYRQLVRVSTRAVRASELSERNSIILENLFFHINLLLSKYLQGDFQYIHYLIKNLSRDICGGIVLPEANPLSRFLIRELRRCDIPSYTVDTCLLAGFDGAGIPSCSYNFISGRWNALIYKKRHLSRQGKILVTGAPRYETARYRKKPYSGRVIYATENSGVEKIAHVAAGLTDISGQLEVWLHPCEAIEETKTVLRNLSANSGVKITVRQGPYDYKSVPGSVCIVEHSTMGIDLALRGGVLISFTPEHNHYNPYLRYEEFFWAKSFEDISDYISQMSFPGEFELQLAKQKEIITQEFHSKGDANPSEVIFNIINRESTEKARANYTVEDNLSFS